MVVVWYAVCNKINLILGVLATLEGLVLLTAQLTRILTNITATSPYKDSSYKHVPYRDFSYVPYNDTF